MSRKGKNKLTPEEVDDLLEGLVENILKSMGVDSVVIVATIYDAKVNETFEINAFRGNKHALQGSLESLVRVWQAQNHMEAQMNAADIVDGEPMDPTAPDFECREEGEDLI